MDNALFLAAFLFGYTMQAITGFAGNIFSMPVGTRMLGLNSSVAILNTTGCIACTALAAQHRADINWRELAKITLTMLPFIALGIWLDRIIPLDWLLKIYGAVILAVALKNLIQKGQRFLPEWALWLVLAGAGLIQGMFVSGGALLVIYAVQKIPDKLQFRATLSALWAILNFLYAAFAASQGYFTGDVWFMLACCIPLIVLGNIIGTRLSKYVSQQRFLTLTYALLVAIGVVLLIT